MATRTKLPVARPPHGLIIESHQFHLGYREALTNSQPLPRFDMRDDPNEAGIVEIIRNLCEMYQEGTNWDEDLLQHDAGLIAGWVYRLAVKVRV